MSIRNRILLGPIAAICLLIVFGIVAYQALSSQGRAMEEINDVRFEHYRMSTAMADRVSRAHLDMFRLVTWFQAYDKTMQERLISEVNQSLTGIDRDLASWVDDQRFSDEEKQEIAALYGLLGQYKKSTDTAIFMVKIDVTSALGDMKTVEGNYQKLAKAFAALDELEQRLSAETYAAAKSASNRALGFNVFVLLAAIGIAAAIGLTTARQLLQQLGGEPAAAAEVAARIAAGDLTVKVPPAPKGSLMAAMEEMRNGLRKMIGQMNDHSSELSSASQQLASASRHVARSSTEQNDAAASMAASIEQMSVSISSVAENSQQASALSAASGETAVSGSQIILGASHEMESIAASVNHVAASIEQLGQQADQISSVVTVIREVAEQTNLLALNAAIEAARAGEQGRGFAVVADEVRKLAERTAKSTSEISKMVDVIQRSAGDAVDAMHNTVKQAEHGLGLAHGAGEAVGNIKEGAAQVVTAVASISAALAEQGTVTQSIAQHVERIARMSEDNNTRAAESADAAGHLQKLAQAMRQQVGQFQV
jgi:methyl-accepting chemotaxis protein